jgi:hypothetical protein
MRGPAPPAGEHSGEMPDARAGRRLARADGRGAPGGEAPPVWESGGYPPGQHGMKADREWLQEEHESQFALTRAGSVGNLALRAREPRARYGCGLRSRGPAGSGARGPAVRRTFPFSSSGLGYGPGGGPLRRRHARPRGSDGRGNPQARYVRTKDSRASRRTLDDRATGAPTQKMETRCPRSSS